MAVECGNRRQVGGGEAVHSREAIAGHGEHALALTMLLTRLFAQLNREVAHGTFEHSPDARMPHKFAAVAWGWRWFTTEQTPGVPETVLSRSSTSS